MRMIFGVLSLLFVLASVGFLAKKQLASVNATPVPAVSASPADASALPTTINPTGNVQQQSQQIQQQFKAAAEAAVQQARPMPDDKP